MKKSPLLSLLFAFTVITCLLACHNHEESPALKEAVEIHKNIRQLCGDLEDGIDQQMTVIEAQLNDASVKADSITAVQLAKVNAELVDLRGGLKNWKDDLVEVPGHCFHEEGEPHEHHDQAHLNGLSDAEILEIQKELEAELNVLSEQLNNIKNK